MPELRDHADRDLITRTRFTARTAHTENQLADSFGIVMHNPYLDARLLDITLGVHGWLRGSPHQYKPLLTTATAGLLPETVRNRAAKGTFVGDHHEGLRRNLHHVLDLADGRLAGRGLITLDKLRSEIHMAAAGRNIHWGHLQRVLAAEVWLRSLESAGPIDWAIPTTEVSAA
jgi:asparagine synthase (glutamine-hydrolysing)